MEKKRILWVSGDVPHDRSGEEYNDHEAFSGYSLTNADNLVDALEGIASEKYGGVYLSSLCIKHVRSDNEGILSEQVRKTLSSKQMETRGLLLASECMEREVPVLIRSAAYGMGKRLEGFELFEYDIFSENSFENVLARRFDEVFGVGQ